MNLGADLAMDEPEAAAQLLSTVWPATLGGRAVRGRDLPSDRCSVCDRNSRLRDLASGKSILMYGGECNPDAPLVAPHALAEKPRRL